MKNYVMGHYFNFFKNQIRNKIHETKARSFILKTFNKEYKIFDKWSNELISNSYDSTQG